MIHLQAAYNGRLSLVKFLVEEGASLSMDSDECQNTPLHATAINGHVEVVLVYIDVSLIIINKFSFLRLASHPREM